MPDNLNSPKVLFVVHHGEDDIGHMGPVMDTIGLGHDTVCPMSGDPLPTQQHDYAAVVVFGGICSANDDHNPVIRQEIEWLVKWLERDQPVFGICLGAQLMARALGAQVYRPSGGECEVGYYEITAATQGRDFFGAPTQTFYQWHEDGFELPTGAVRLASSNRFPNQAFRAGKHGLAVQFHPEVTRAQNIQWLDASYDQFKNRPGVHTAQTQLSDQRRHGHRARQWLAKTTKHWLQVAGIINP